MTQPIERSAFSAIFSSWYFIFLGALKLIYSVFFGLLSTMCYKVHFPIDLFKVYLVTYSIPFNIILNQRG